MTSLIPLVLLGLGALAVLGLHRLVCWMERRGWVDLRKQKVSGGIGHGMLGLQEFVEPGVAHILETENREHFEVEEDLNQGDDLDLDQVRADLAEILRQTPIDNAEVRTHLTRARRAGMDWRRIYDEAVRAELAERPYRAPAMPPAARVAPWDG
jgi:hypothetical protein